MNRLVHNLLALLVFACPLWCAWTSYVSTTSGDSIQVASCCRCQTRLPESDSSPGGLPTRTPDRETDAPSQCICGGATLAAAFELQHCDVSWDLERLAQLLHVATPLERSEFVSVECDTGNELSGRMLRQRYSSWLL